MSTDRTGKGQDDCYGDHLCFSIRWIKRITEIGEDEEGSSRKILKVKTFNKRKMTENQIFIS